MNREEMLFEMEWLLRTIQMDIEKLANDYQRKREEIYAKVYKIYCTFEQSK